MSDRSPTDTETVDLPEHVVERIERRLPDTRFDSVDAYATAALEALLREVDHPSDGGHGETAEADVEDDGEVRRQLESLGYL